MASAISKLLILAAVTLFAGCGEKEKGAFHGDENYAALTRGYSRTKDEAEKLLHEHQTREGTSPSPSPKYGYFPYQVIYAHDGGYLFVVGDFKVSFSLEGYYVDAAGGVNWLDLERNLSVKDYRGSREQSAIFKR